MLRTPNINVVLEIRDPDNWHLYPDKYEVLDVINGKLQAVSNRRYLPVSIDETEMMYGLNACADRSSSHC
jgi:hypothetical protein